MERVKVKFSVNGSNFTDSYAILASYLGEAEKILLLDAIVFGRYYM